MHTHSFLLLKNRCSLALKHTCKRPSKRHNTLFLFREKQTRRLRKFRRTEERKRLHPTLFCSVSLSLSPCRTLSLGSPFSFSPRGRTDVRPGAAAAAAAAGGVSERERLWDAIFPLFDIRNSFSCSPQNSFFTCRLLRRLPNKTYFSLIQFVTFPEAPLTMTPFYET